MKSKALVTGAAGFIGSHLVDSLTADGIPVRSLVKPDADQSNLKDIQSEIVCGDIRNPDAVRRAVQGVDTVYHLAAISRHDTNLPDVEYFSVNVDGTKNLLEAAAGAGVRRFVYTGTIEAVGLSKDGKPLTEETPQIPRNIYGQTKLEGEKITRDFAAARGINTVVVRPPMTYGPREMILLGRLFKVIARGFYPLIGDGKALTEFCYVKNQVHGIRLAAERGRPAEVYFISDERSYTIEEIVRTIARVIGARVVTPRLPIPLANAVGLAFEILSRIFRFYPFVIPQTGRSPFSRKTVAWTSQSRLYCDISKAKNELNYSPPFNLETGLHETIQWYRQQGHLKP